MDLKEMGWDDMEWIDPAQDRDNENYQFLKDSIPWGLLVRNTTEHMKTKYNKTDIGNSHNKHNIVECNVAKHM